MIPWFECLVNVDRNALSTLVVVVQLAKCWVSINISVSTSTRNLTSVIRYIAVVAILHSSYESDPY